MTDAKNEVATTNVICNELAILADMGENFDQLQADEYSAVFSAIRALVDKVAAGLNDTAKQENPDVGILIHLKADDSE
ncbi:hypothetical protein R0137_11100 [Congregibacter brevis]|uniref:Uncharacterized protein n=1 Tax=Congregibacter brevis TaxID=3081201 RepID=A0ABZ0IAF5_9GAMM|nr:hypothetical protein R0137_11100 [Congregibacter sp. IMCC45268]